MTAYALYGLIEARRDGYRVDEERIERGVRALAALYAEYPRAEPDLKAYMAYVLRRAPADSSAAVRGDRTPCAATSSWSARERMRAYGRALLLLALDDAEDARGNELAAALIGRGADATAS